MFYIDEIEHFSNDGSFLCNAASRGPKRTSSQIGREFKFPMNVDQIDEEMPLRGGGAAGDCCKAAETGFTTFLFTILLFSLQLQNRGQQTLTQKIAALYPGVDMATE